MNHFIIKDERARARVAELNLMTYNVLGAGANGIIYSAKGVLRGTTKEGTYAVKVITREEKPEALRREIEVSNMLKERPIKGAVRVFHAELIDEYHGIVIMECMDTNLADYLESKRFLSEYEAKKIIAPILDAICSLNERGYMHRDVKIGNILMKKVGDEWVSRLGDFGEVRKFEKEDQEDNNFTVIGTVGYAALEVNSGNYNEKVDMWSLGVVLFRMLYGYMPFNCESAKEYKKCLEIYAQSGEKESIFDRRVKVSKECLEFLQGLMDPNERTRWSCIKAATSTFIMQSITLWYIESGELPSFKRVVLTRKDIDTKKDMKEVTWEDLATFVASKIESERKRCGYTLVITKDGRCLDVDQKVDKTGMFSNPIEAFLLFEGDDEVTKLFSFKKLKEEEEERYELVVKRGEELKKATKRFEINMNLGRIKEFIDILSRHASSEFDALFSLAESCSEGDIMSRAACAAFTHVVSEELNPGIAKFIDNASKFESIPEFTMKTFLPLKWSRLPLDEFMKDYGVKDIVGKAKEVTQTISMLREEVMKISQMNANRILLAKSKKSKKEKEEEDDGGGDKEKQKWMSEEEILRKAHGCARDLKDLSERMKTTVVMALKWRLGETWNSLIMECIPLRIVKRMARDLLNSEDSNSTNVLKKRKTYEDRVFKLLTEVEGCIAIPYVPNDKDTIKYLQKDCEALKKENEKLKK